MRRIPLGDTSGRSKSALARATNSFDLMAYASVRPFEAVLRPMSLFVEDHCDLSIRARPSQPFQAMERLFQRLVVRDLPVFDMATKLCCGDFCPLAANPGPQPVLVQM